MPSPVISITKPMITEIISISIYCSVGLMSDGKDVEKKLPKQAPAMIVGRLRI